MSYLDQSVYADVEQEAHYHWLCERPDPEGPDFDAAEECSGCGRPVCGCEVGE